MGEGMGSVTNHLYVVSVGHIANLSHRQYLPGNVIQVGDENDLCFRCNRTLVDVNDLFVRLRVEGKVDKFSYQAQAARLLLESL